MCPVLFCRLSSFLYTDSTNSAFEFVTPSALAATILIILIPIPTISLITLITKPALALALALQPTLYLSSTALCFWHRLFSNVASCPRPRC